jgi:outer membrane immunogenic protein
VKHLAYAAVLALLAAPAGAADLKMPTKAPPIAAPPVAAWSGCYVGANVGGGWAREHYVDPLAVPPEFLGRHSADGVVGGGQVGCDWQYGAWVFGVQGMFDGADLRGNHVTDDVFDTRIPWFATATARIGYLIHPSLLLYVKGGGAWKRQEETITDAVTGLVEAVATKTRTGYVVGGGFEWMFWQNWSFFTEFNYMGFGNRNITFAALPEPGDIGIPPPFPLTIRENVAVALVGVNYRFTVPGFGP